MLINRVRFSKYRQSRVLELAVDVSTASSSSNSVFFNAFTMS